MLNHFPAIVIMPAKVVRVANDDSMLVHVPTVGIIAPKIFTVTSHRRGGTHHHAGHSQTAQAQQNFSGLSAKAGGLNRPTHVLICPEHKSSSGFSFHPNPQAANIADLPGPGSRFGITSFVLPYLNGDCQRGERPAKNLATCRFRSKNGPFYYAEAGQAPSME
jgi:hypothetical protein